MLARANRVHIVAIVEPHSSARSWCGRDIDYSELAYTHRIEKGTCLTCLRQVQWASIKQLRKVLGKRR